MNVVQPWHSPARSDAPARPLPALLPWAAAAAVALAVGWGIGLRITDLIVLPVALVLLGLIKTGQRWNARRRRCSVADAWLRSGGRAAQFQWRADELTAPGERHLLARSLRSVVRELGSPPGLRSAVPLNRRALRPHTDELAALAERLDDLECPVAPAGILEVQRLLTSPGSPLHLYGNEADLSETLTAIHHELEAR
ncbi:MAG TPA: hypothetical protein VMT59_02940 [Gaiellaceae bacterium]|nr:hypothetical protein [Gaiellaceae bacterium]